MNAIVVIIFIIYVITILSLQYFKTSNNRYKCIIRKSVHFVTGLVIFFLSFHFEKGTLLIILSAGTAFSFFTYRIKKFNFIHTTSGSSFGTLFYPIGLLLSFIILYNMPICYFQLALMILSVSDTIANIGGEIKTWNTRFTVFKDEKSLLGVAGFAVSAYLLHLVLLPESFSGAYLFIILSVIAAINFEVISFRGSDNFSIPVGCALFFLLTQKVNLNLYFTVTLIPFLAAGSVLFYKKNILTRYGSLAAYLLGVYLFAVLGTAWSVPVLTFFITSVVLTKIDGVVNRKSDDSNRRNAWQVCANILFAVISSACYIVTKNEIFIFFFITLVATVTADTWASELGPVFSKRCFSLSDFKFKDSGTSGGVSIYGTAAAAVGSLVISVISYYLFFNKTDTAMIAAIALAGFAAVFVDSILSAFLEPLLIKMSFFADKYSEDSISPNDIVNLTASATAPVFYILLKLVM